MQQRHREGIPAVVFGVVLVSGFGYVISWASPETARASWTAFVCFLALALILSLATGYAIWIHERRKS
jgi:hypothetical protein